MPVRLKYTGIILEVNMITFLLTNLIDGRVIYVSMPEEEYKEKFLMGNTSFSSDWYYEPEESENVTMEEMIQEVRDIKVSKEIQKIWLEQNRLLQQG